MNGPGAPVTSYQPQPDKDVLDVIILGAGFGGVAAAIKLRERGIDNILVLEKAAGIGGTWWHNTYPGAACDIQSHLYCYSFEPNPNWSRKYSPQPEIQAYIEHCVDKYDIRRHIQLGAEVKGFQFDDQRGVWQAQLADGSTFASRHVIFATGGLHLPAFPDIPGMKDFAGASMHTAEWDHSVDFDGKRVAVIGSAASAIQLIPEVAKIAAHVEVYQRTPNYIAPRHDRAYSEREKARFARWPWLNRLYRKLIFLRGEYIIFPIVKTKHQSGWRNRAEHMVRRHIRDSVRDPDMREAMIPHFPLGCKRILIADNFYDAMNRPSVDLVTAGIERIEADAVITADGERHPADIIVYATGFDLENYMRKTEVIGPGGVALSDLWADKPQAYKGGFIPGIPNFYMTTGPNTGVGSTSVVYMIEAQLRLILQAIEAAGPDQLIEVTQQACERYNREIRDALQETVWAGDCQSWYKRPDGEITTLYPYDARTFLRDHKHLVHEDFTLRPARQPLKEYAI
jgi:cation diffusion facilitator CzcD-associated flavoprotein CzcO